MSMVSPTATWEIAQALGLGAVAACLILCVLSVRPRAGADGAFSLRGHELIGWFAVAAAILHVGLLLRADPRVVEHLRLTAPRYEYAGILALFTLLYLTLPAGTAIRGRLWARHRSFQAAHVGAACLLVVALAVHVLAADRYVHGHAQAAAYTLLSSVALLALLRARLKRQPPRQSSTLHGGLVFGRHSRLVLVILLASLIALIAVIRASSAPTLREPFVPRTDSLVLRFPHEKHRQVNCIQCHHNFVDRSGDGPCIGCHRSGGQAIRVGAEARFHDFCLGCHRSPPPPLTGHGPVTGCSTCHAPNSAFAPQGLQPIPGWADRRLKITAESVPETLVDSINFSCPLARTLDSTTRSARVIL